MTTGVADRLFRMILFNTSGKETRDMTLMFQASLCNIHRSRWKDDLKSLTQAVVARTSLYLDKSPPETQKRQKQIQVCTFVFPSDQESNMVTACHIKQAK
jgi:hypothetical protein